MKIRITLSQDPVANADPSLGTPTQLTRCSCSAITPRRSPLSVSNTLQLQLSDPTKSNRPDRENATDVLGTFDSVLKT